VTAPHPDAAVLKIRPHPPIGLALAVIDTAGLGIDVRLFLDQPVPGIDWLDPVRHVVDVLSVDA
jgi:hypothetical protein